MHVYMYVHGIGVVWIILYCIKQLWCCVASYSIVLHCVVHVLYVLSMRCIALCIVHVLGVLYVCIVLLYVLHVLCCIVLHRTLFHSVILYFNVLCYICCCMCTHGRRCVFAFICLCVCVGCFAFAVAIEMEYNGLRYVAVYACARLHLYLHLSLDLICVIPCWVAVCTFCTACTVCMFYIRRHCGGVSDTSERLIRRVWGGSPRRSDTRCFWTSSLRNRWKNRVFCGKCKEVQGNEGKIDMTGKQGEMKGKQRGTERDMKGTEMKTRGLQGEGKGNKGRGNQSARREM